MKIPGPIRNFLKRERKKKKKGFILPVYNPYLAGPQFESVAAVQKTVNNAVASLCNSRQVRIYKGNSTYNMTLAHKIKDKFIMDRIEELSKMIVIEETEHTIDIKLKHVHL